MHSKSIGNQLVKEFISICLFFKFPLDQSKPAQSSNVPHVRFADSLYLNVTLCDVHLFACNRYSVCLMTSLNRASISVINDSTAITVKGSELHYMKQISGVRRLGNIVNLHKMFVENIKFSLGRCQNYAR